jgi:hypothetical protein
MIINRTSLSLEVSPGSPYSAGRLDGTTPQANAVETLHVGQSCHTSDFEEDLAGDEGRILGAEAAETLENEGWNKFHAGQHRGSGIEQRPVTEIAMRRGYDGGPRRP